MTPGHTIKYRLSWDIGGSKDVLTFTDNTLTGPWHVCSYRTSRFWYIINIETRVTRKIGPVKSKGSNNCDKARALARARNEKLQQKD